MSLVDLFEWPNVIEADKISLCFLLAEFSKPLSWDMWVAVREMVDWVVANWDQPDLSIWEVSLVAPWYHPMPDR